MKRYTALFTAILFVLVLAGGGVVCFFTSVNAAVNPQYEVPDYINNSMALADTFNVGYYSNGQAAYGITKGNGYNEYPFVCVRYFTNSNHTDINYIVMTTGQYYFTRFGYANGDFNTPTYSKSVSSYQCDTKYGDYYYKSKGTIPYDSQFPVAENLDSALVIAANALNYVEPGNEYTFNIPAGYAAYIQYNADTEFNMYCQMLELSRAWITGPKPDFWESSNTYYSFTTSVPNLNSTFDYSNYTRVLWERGSDRDAFGQTQSAVFSSELEYYNNVPFFVIYNYTYYDNDYLSPTITVNFDNALAVYLVEINGNTVAKISDVSTDGVVTNPDTGDFENPTPGGGNYIPEDSNLETTLSGLINDIDSFFRGTWQYVRQLVQSISTFPQMITELYSWLPTEYRVVLFSAFSIVVVVGVLKVML